MIDPNSSARKGGKERGEVKGGMDYGGMVQHSQQHVAPCLKGVRWELGTRGLRMLAAFW